MRLVNYFTLILSFAFQQVSGQMSIQYLEKYTDSIVLQKMSVYELPGLAIGITINGKMEYLKGYGVKSIETKESVTTQSIFHTASISKLFTAISISQLEQRGMLSFDDTVIKILPDLKYSDLRVKKITIRSLLNHSSGLPDIFNYQWENNNQDDTSLKRYIEHDDLKLISEPGLSFVYSNLGYDLLGLIIEKVSGLSFEDYAAKFVLTENKMTSTDFRYYRIPDSLRVAPHSRDKLTGKVYKRLVYPYTREHAPSSTLNSSVVDLTKWMASFMNSLTDLHTHFNYNELIKPTLNEKTGLGFQLGKLENHKTVGHFGGDQGFRSYLLMIPELKIGIVLLANCDYNENFRQEIVQAIAKKIITVN